jgi:fimbrial chaperone protein
MVNSRFNLLLTALFLLVCTLDARAFTLVPIRMEFTPSGSGAEQAFHLENDSSNTVAIEVSMLTRQLDLDGKETNAPAEDDFLVYPPQVVLKPNQVQTVRVKWLGTRKPEKELAYRILAEQLPVKLEKDKTGHSRINVLLRYLGSVYIVPKGSKADVILESAAPQTDAAGKRQIVLIFHNRGKAHGLLSDLQLKIEAGDKTVELGSEALPNIAGQNILAGQKRRFMLSWPEGLPDGPLRVTFDFTKHL